MSEIAFDNLITLFYQQFVTKLEKFIMFVTYYQSIYALRLPYSSYIILIL